MPASRSPFHRLVALLGALLLVPLVALVGAAPAQAAPNQLTGVVADGLGDPVAEVTVAALTALGEPTGTSTTTSAEGAYTLTLTEGSYQLSYSKAGYESQLYGAGAVVIVDDSGQASVGGEPLADNVLDPVSLASRTTYPITGTVVRAGGTPLAGIAVAIYAADDEATPLQTATTDAGGAYAFTQPAGVYHVQFTDPAHEYLSQWYGGTSRDITVSASTPLGQTTLDPVPVAAEYPVAGQVVDANGDPVSGVAVAVDHVGDSTDAGTDTTNATGDYSASVLPGTYRVTFTRTGWTTAQYGNGAIVTVANDGTLSTNPAADLVGNKLNDHTLVSTSFAVTGAVEADGVGLDGITVRAFPGGSTDVSEVVATATSASGGGYTLNLPVGTYDLQLVDDDGVAPTYATASLSGVKVAQGGVLTVAGGEAVATLPDVTMALSSADTPHPVVGSVSDATGAPVDGLGVTAVPQSGGEQATATTGADAPLGDHGRYRLMLKPGSYLVTVAGGSAWSDASYVGGGSTAALVTVQANGTVLVNGVEAVGGELGDTVMVGTTKYTLSGTVTDGSVGLPGITVKAYADDDRSTAVASTTSTGSTGAWSLTSAQGLVVGTYVIELSGTSGGTTYVTTYFGGSTATLVEMGQGGVARVGGSPVAGNTLSAVTMTASSADTTYDVVGDVVDANGDAIPGVTVTAVPQSPTPAGNQVGTTTDSAGHYVLAVKQGTYRVTYAKTGFTTATYPVTDPAADVVVANGGGVTTGGSTMPGGDLGDVALTGTTAYPLSGTVTGGGTALSGITVTAYRESSTATAVEQATTDGSGAWELSTLVVGTYVLKFTDTRSPAQYNETWLGGSIPGTSVKVGQGGAITRGSTPVVGHDLGAQAMSAVSVDDEYDVVGEVDDVNGDPINGITVTAIPVLGTPGANQKSQVTGADTAPGSLGDAGIYRLGLKAGKYHLRFSGTGYPTTTLRNGDDTADAVVEVVLGNIVKVDGTTTPGGVIDSVTLTGTARWPVAGKVVRSGGVALAGITVQAIPDGASTPAATTTTAANGTYSLSLLVGTYTLKFLDQVADSTTYVTAFYGGTPPALVKVATGGGITVDDVAKSTLDDVTLAVATSDATYPLRGTVYGPDFEPLDGVTVTAVPVGGTAAGNVVSDQSGLDPAPGAPLGDHGAYELRVRPGKYQLRYAKSGYQTTMLRSFDDDTVPVTLTVGLNGDVTATPALELVDGIIDDVAMQFPAAAFATTPKLSGVVAVGQTVQTTVGTLKGASIDNDYVTISWFLDGEPADDFSTGSIFQKFKVPASAAGKKLSYTVAIDDPDGLRAASVYTSPSFPVPYLATVKAAVKKGVLTLTLSAKGAPAPVGKIVLKEGKKTVGKATLTAKSKGKAVIKLTKLKKGKHKLVVVFGGGGGYGPSQTTITVKV